MRWLINYIRQCFCNHEFEKEEIKVFYYGNDSNRPSYRDIHLECNKCGYHKKYKK